jgi:hypothetical protein
MPAMTTESLATLTDSEFLLTIVIRPHGTTTIRQRADGSCEAVALKVRRREIR